MRGPPCHFPFCLAGTFTVKRRRDTGHRVRWEPGSRLPLELMSLLSCSESVLRTTISAADVLRLEVSVFQLSGWLRTFAGTEGDPPVHLKYTWPLEGAPEPTTTTTTTAPRCFQLSLIPTEYLRPGQLGFD